MELLLAGPTGQLRQLVAGAVKDEEADVALLDAVEPLVQVLLPDGEPVHDGAVLVLKECGQLQHPEREIDTKKSMKDRDSTYINPGQSYQHRLAS